MSGTLVIFSKTLRDASSLRRNIAYLLILLLVPLIAGGALRNSDMGGIAFTKLSLGMQTQFALGVFLMLTFLWTAGIPLALLSAITCGSFIAKEDEEGTLLLLVSKPVRRHEMVAGKFLAFLLNAAVLELLGLLLSSLAMFASLGADISVLGSFLSLVPRLFVYSLLVAFAFGSVSLFLSALLRSRMKAIVVLAVLVIAVFLGFGTVRGFLGPIYADYCMYGLDLNYHLGNAYLSIVGRPMFVRIIPDLQSVIGRFTGIFPAATSKTLYDKDIGALPGSLQPVDYVAPALSLALWLAIAAGFLALAIVRFETMEIER